MRSQLAIYASFFLLIAHILTFRDRKYLILTFRDKTELYLTVLHQNNVAACLKCEEDPSGSLSGSLWLTLALSGSPSGSLWLAVWLTMAHSGSLWLSLALPMAPSGSLWLAVQLTLAPYGSLWPSQAHSGLVWLAPWLSLALSGSLLLSQALYCPPNLLTKSLLGSQGHCSHPSSSSQLSLTLQKEA